MEEAMELRPLEYRLVQIVGQAPLDPSPEALERDSKAEKLDVDGKIGQTLAWAEEQKKYVVETFDGDLVAISEENLKEFHPPPVEEAGFDVAFPGSEPRAEAFQSDLAEIVLDKKYCVVQMTMKAGDRQAAFRTVQETDAWARFMPEFEHAYMGQNPGGKRVMWIAPESPGLPGDEIDPSVGLALADQQLTNLGVAVGNICPYFGFNGVCRSNAMVHMNCASADEEHMLQEEVSGQAVGAGMIQGHLSFSRRRKICMIYFVQGSGGTLTLHPANRGDEDITISCREGQAVVFRHDLCDYTFLPEGRQLAMQAWIFREAHAGETSLTQHALLAFEDVLEDIPRSPNYGNTGQVVDVMSLSSRIPGLVQCGENYWAGLSSGYDGVIRIPLARWDHDMYFLAGSEDIPGTGKAYTQHKGLLDNDEQMMVFDNEFFGLSEDEVVKMDPPARCTLEVGYDILYRGGWTRKKLNGTAVTCIYGTANNEFETQQLQQWRMGISNDTRLQLDLSVRAARLQFIFGMQGPCATTETACSSSLMAVGLCHTYLRPDQHGQLRTAQQKLRYGIAMGANGHFDPFYMIGLCGAKMLSIQGRCFTFDQSGDGFVRGEGVAGMYFKVSDSEDLGRLAMLCGSCMNQDGRSASLTAPHGPSQQECIRHSLRESGIPPLMIQMQELHGTGTALGDPIEVGALRATMMMYQGEVRDHPLVKTSSKSNIGHTELCAGMCGIMKCVLMGVHCMACPNNHIRLLNPHIDSNAYPVYFATEAVDQGKNEGYLGVSSFGFGGSNARGDIWSRALAGPRNTNPGGPRLCLTEERALIWSEISKQSIPQGKKGGALDAALENLDAYEDAYLTGQAFEEGDAFYCTGSFNGWSGMEKMTYDEDSQSYSFAFPLGETRVEQFQLALNGNEYFKVFPASKMADQDALILGPGIAPHGNNWVVDGRSQGVPQGTVYLLTLQWDLETRTKRISWEPSTDEVALELAAGLKPFRHKYHMLSTWSLWKPVEMQPARGGEPGTFEATMKIGIQRHEEFRFIRDGDKFQAIYPARQRASETDDAAMSWTWTEAGVAAAAGGGLSEQLGRPKAGEAFTAAHLDGLHAKEEMASLSQTDLASMGYISGVQTQTVPICGPDHLGEGKRWLLDGVMGETVRISLRVWEGDITVTTSNHRTGLRTWTSQQADLRRKYFVTATWNNWGYTQMRAEPTADGGKVYYLKAKMPEEQMVAFQVVVDEDPAQAIHPEMALTDQLLSPALGPDANGEGLYWGLYVARGSVVEVKLDLSQSDRRKAVTWTLDG